MESGPVSKRTDLTQMLRAAGSGNESAVNDLLPLVYDELRALAESFLKHERKGLTLQATALVHEAYLRLIKQDEVEWRDRTHFFVIAAQVIRRILVDHARERRRLKRGGDRARVQLDDDVALLPERDLDLVALDEALARLAQLDPRQARLVELRFFGGLTLQEIADFQNVSLRTVTGDWSMARAWLRRELEKDG